MVWGSRLAALLVAGDVIGAGAGFISDRRDMVVVFCWCLMVTGRAPIRLFPRNLTDLGYQRWWGGIGRFPQIFRFYAALETTDSVRHCNVTMLVILAPRLRTVMAPALSSSGRMTL